jgi:hypothetical protein
MASFLLKMANRLAIFAILPLLQSTVLGQQDAEPLENVEGEITIVQACDFTHHHSERFYSLKEKATGKTYALRFEQEPATRLRSGAKVRIKARKAQNELLAPANGGMVETLDFPTEVVAGNRRTVVLAINFQNAQLECSVAAIDAMMFGATQSVDQLYREMSVGNVSFTGDVFGSYTIPYNSNGQCDYNGWAAAAEAAAQADGVNLAAYANRVYVFPSSNLCAWAGLGTIGGNPGRAWVAVCTAPDVYAHELGHNLTMHHSSTDANNDGVNDCEYCDVSDVMGYAGYGLRQINGAHRDQMGWLPTNKVVNVNSSATYNIAPLESSSQDTPYPQLLKIAAPNTGEYYYLSYRRKFGFDANMQSAYADKVNVHHYHGSGAIQTFLIGMLPDNGVFNDATTGVTVTQLGHNNDYATLYVSFGCTPVTSTAVLSPISQSGAPLVTRNYFVTVTNRDAVNCGNSTFQLVASAPDGWSVSIQPSSMTLGPGVAGGARLSVRPPAGATNGTYSVGVSISDNFTPEHNRSVAGNYGISTVDTSAPSTPSNLVAISKHEKVKLHWSRSTDNVRVAKYSVWRDGVPIGETRSTRFTDAEVSAGETHTYYVQAEDAAGNVSPASNTAGLVVEAKRRTASA